MSSRKRKNENMGGRGANGHWRDDRVNKKNKNKTRSGDENKQDPALLQRQRDIEEALRLQRLRRGPLADALESPLESNETVHPRCSGDTDTPEKHIDNIPGYYYDENKQRFFKLSKDLKAPVIYPTSSSNTEQIKASHVDSIVNILQRRSLGVRCDIKHVLSALVCRNNVEFFSRSDASEMDVLSVHNKYGFVATSSPNIYKFESSYLPSTVSVANRNNNARVVAVNWSPDTEVPILACTKYTVTEDSVDVVKFEPHTDGHFRAMIHTVSGTNNTGRHKEIINCTEWAFDGESFYTGGDGTLTRVCLTGRGGDHSMIRRPSHGMVNCILPAKRDTVIIGLRNGIIRIIDDRQSVNSSGNVLGKMNFAIDHLHLMRKEYSMISQDITNNIHFYDIRRPSALVHIIRGSSSVTDRDCSVRCRKFWVSPKSELMAVSNNKIKSGGTYKEESLSVLDPLKSALDNNEIFTFLARSADARSAREERSLTETRSTVGYWRLASNSVSSRITEHDMMMGSDKNVSMEWEHCFGLFVSEQSASYFHLNNVSSTLH